MPIIEIDPRAMDTTPTHPLPRIAFLLTKYRVLFQTPSHLEITHNIHLLPNSNPVNVRPYRLPHFQKGEIEKKVNELLSSGMIQLSHNPFSSHFYSLKRRTIVGDFALITEL